LIEKEDSNISYSLVKDEQHIIREIMDTCFKLNLQSILVEGGAKLLQSFIDEGIWDEARVIVNNELIISKGLHAPLLKDHDLQTSEKIASDTVHYYTNKLIN
jgi:diaminohydroxyphosphoribosylaminopyrimidine deaminase/5-amino-6-(5-phosphoribosylamino)uracil reductase